MCKAPAPNRTQTPITPECPAESHANRTGRKGLGNLEEAVSVSVLGKGSLNTVSKVKAGFHMEAEVVERVLKVQVHDTI